MRTVLAIVGSCWLAGLAAASADAPTLPPPPDTIADGLVAHVLIQPEAVTVGDPVTVQLAVYHPTNSVVSEATVNPESTGFDGDLVDRDIVTTELTDFRRTLVTWTLIPFETGRFPFSTNAVTVVQSDRVTLTLPFPEAEIVVESVLAEDDSEIRPPKPPAPLTPTWPSVLRRVAIIGGCIILLAVLLGLLLAWLLKRKQAPEAAPPPPDPYAVAMEQLAALRAEALTLDEAETFFVRLSSIVRNYIEGRFGLHAPEMTTEEFIRFTSAHPTLSQEHQRSTSDFLLQSDLVKFARYQPDESLMQESLQAAEALVADTRPQEGGA